MEIKLFDSELKIMEILWKGGETTARSIAETLKEQIGWSKTTTYTVIKKCIDQGVSIVKNQVLSADLLLQKSRCRNLRPEN